MIISLPTVSEPPFLSTDAPDAAPGDIATLLGTDGSAAIRAEELAARCGTITNELLSRLGSRLGIVVR
mgnify:CR=1 FL=1